MGTSRHESDILKDISGRNAVLLRNQPITRAILEAEPRLRVVAKNGGGFDQRRPAGHLGGIRPLFQHLDRSRTHHRADYGLRQEADLF